MFPFLSPLFFFLSYLSQDSQPTPSIFEQPKRPLKFDFERLRHNSFYLCDVWPNFLTCSDIL